MMGKGCVLWHMPWVPHSPTWTQATLISHLRPPKATEMLLERLRLPYSYMTTYTHTLRAHRCMCVCEHKHPHITQTHQGDPLSQFSQDCPCVCTQSQGKPLRPGQTRTGGHPTHLSNTPYLPEKAEYCSRFS